MARPDQLRAQLVQATKAVAKNLASEARERGRARQARTGRERDRHNAAADKRLKERATLEKKRADTQSALNRAESQAHKQEERAVQNLVDRLQADQEQRERELRGQLSAAFDELDRLRPAAEGDYDAFLSHASPDKDEIARPLDAELTERGLRIWYDEAVLRVGDSLRERIDAGLVKSRFGIVILSPAFFASGWSRHELNGLAARAIAEDRGLILPLWHNVSKDQVMAFSPPLADVVAISTANRTIAEIANLLHDTITDRPRR